MEIKAEVREFYDIDVEALVIAIFEGENTDQGFLKELDERSGKLLGQIIGSEEMRGRPSDIVFLHQPGNIRSKRLLLVGAGKAASFSVDSVSRYAGTAARFLRSKGVRSMALVRRSNLDLASGAQAAVEGVLMGLFEPDQYKTSEREDRQIDRLVLVASEAASEDIINRAISRGRIIGEAVNFARGLSNEPSCILTPSELANRAHQTAEQFGLAIDVLDEAKMKELGMGALLGVSRGSDEPCKLIVLRYNGAPGGPTAEPVAIVGKGITFDSGGISIKPADGMERMKYDMSGAAATLAVMRAIAQLKPSVNIIGLMPTSENMPSGHAYKPGDVLRAMSGKTIEVINTDAEGRLILADAISYARKLGATRIIDLATLTGAVSIALGSVYAAILGNDQILIDEVRKAADAAGERIWQLPMDEPYRDLIKSDIADIKNSGGRYAGTITAAYFLREFAESTPWAHLDIAGTAWESDKKPHTAKGPTGMAIRTLIKFVCGESKN